MDELSVNCKRLKTAHDNHDRDYNETISALSQRESRLNERLYKLNCKKLEVAEANGNLNAAYDDLVEVSAGGKNRSCQAIHPDSNKRNQVGGIVQWAL